MRDTLRSAGGVGLAGPQVALARRVFVVECNGSQILPGPLPFLALFNPRVDTSASAGTERVRVQEGCLSVPGMRALVPRFSDVTVSFFDVFAQRERRIRATGCLSWFTLQCFFACSRLLVVDRCRGHHAARERPPGRYLLSRPDAARDAVQHGARRDGHRQLCQVPRQRGHQEGHLGAPRLRMSTHASRNVPFPPFPSFLSPLFFSFPVSDSRNE